MLNYKLWTPEEKALLKQLCEEGKMSYPEMAAAHFPGRSGASLQGHTRKVMGINNLYQYRKHFHDETFFETPNPLNCYVAGFIAADGCILNPTEDQFILAITLSEIDKDLLERFKHYMSYTGPITSHRREAGWNHVTIRLNGLKQMRLDLMKHFGIGPRKAHRLAPPKLPNKPCELAYLAGLLDGDGCIHCSKNQIIVVKFTSCSRALVDWALALMNDLHLPQISRKMSKVNALKQPNTYELTFAGAKAIHFIHLMRRQGLPLLARKWDNPTLNEAISAYKTRFPDHNWDWREDERSESSRIVDSRV